MSLTLLLARLAILCYLARFPLEAAGRTRLARIAWTAGATLLGLHVLAAFGLVHDWSHENAVSETSRQAREVFGLEAGYGVWVNYVCVVVWAADAARLWLAEPATISRRDAWFWCVQTFLAGMVFFGAVVFGSVWWLAPIAATVGMTIWIRRSRRRRAE